MRSKVLSDNVQGYCQSEIEHPEFIPVPKKPNKHRSEPRLVVEKRTVRFAVLNNKIRHDLQDFRMARIDIGVYVGVVFKMCMG